MNLLLSAITLTAALGTAHGHGYMFEPLSRNYYAQLFGRDWGNEPNVPTKEYCYHCLNTKGPGSVCGTSEGGINYDLWADSNGQPMSWNSNGNIYGEGDTITISSFLTAHHTGHAEVRACPNGRASTQECFDANPLEFVEDLAYSMPKDPNHPERGYYYGAPEFNNEAFSMRFKLPEGLVGEEVLLQWWYVTANSCYPPGYDQYYNTNSFLPKSFYNSVTKQCTPEQYTEEFYTGDWPERFVNCAEITIVSENGNNNNDESEYSSSEDEPAPAPLLSTQPPVAVEVIPMAPPMSPPVAAPVESEESSSSSSSSSDEDDGDGCCSLDFKTCAGWCNDSREQCLIDPACVGSGMAWLEDGEGDDASCSARWGDCTQDADACCDGLECREYSEFFSQCLAPNDP